MKSESLKKIIDLIDGNNATTLIGTVDFDKFTKIRDPQQPYFICDDSYDSLSNQVDRIEKLILTEKQNNDIQRTALTYIPTETDLKVSLESSSEGEQQPISSSKGAQQQVNNNLNLL
jgi:hypothetical protein